MRRLSVNGAIVRGEEAALSLFDRGARDGGDFSCLGQPLPLGAVAHLTVGGIFILAGLFAFWAGSALKLAIFAPAAPPRRVGFLVAAIVTGRLAEIGWDRSAVGAVAAMLMKILFDAVPAFEADEDGGMTAKINKALKVALKDPEFLKKQQGLGAVVVTDKRTDGAEHKKFVAAEIAKWGPIIQAAGVYAD